MSRAPQRHDTRDDGRACSIRLLDSATPVFECDVPTLARIIERDRMRTKGGRIEAAAHPLQHHVMFGVTSVANDLQKFGVPIRTTNVFRRTGARASHAARVRATVAWDNVLELQGVSQSSPKS